MPVPPSTTARSIEGRGSLPSAPDVDSTLRGGDADLDVNSRSEFERPRGATTSTITLEVRVELKPGILDAEADSIQKSLGLLGVTHVSNVATAKVYAISYDGVDLEQAQALTDRAVDQLLANPVVHRVSVAPARS